MNCLHCGSTRYAELYQPSCREKAADRCGGSGFLAVAGIEVPTGGRRSHAEFLRGFVNGSPAHVLPVDESAQAGVNAHEAAYALSSNAAAALPRASSHSRESNQRAQERTFYRRITLAPFHTCDRCPWNHEWPAAAKDREFIVLHQQ